MALYFVIVVVVVVVVVVLVVLVILKHLFVFRLASNHGQNRADHRKNIDKVLQVIFFFFFSFLLLLR